MDRATVQRRLDGPWRRGSELPRGRYSGRGGAVRCTGIDGDLESVSVTAGRGVGMVTRERPEAQRKQELVSPALALSIAEKRPGAAEQCSPAQA